MKDWFITHSPNMFFSALVNLRGKASIVKKGEDWLIQKGNMVLLSPTPKFIGFGLSEFEREFEKFFKIEEGDVCLDVGACIGDTTIPMVLKAGSLGRVIAVEPCPINAEYLRRNVPNYVEIIEKALWREKATLEFHLHGAVTGHSIIPHRERSKSILVEADTLDNLFRDKHMDFAKIDVQGAEAEVLEGGSNFLKNVQKLVVETHDRFGKNATYPKVLEILHSCGFSMTKFSMDNGMVYACR